MLCSPLDFDFRLKTLYIWLGPSGPVPGPIPRYSLLGEKLSDALAIYSLLLSFLSLSSCAPSHLRKSLLGYDVLSGFRAADAVCLEYGSIHSYFPVTLTNEGLLEWAWHCYSTRQL